MIRKECSLDLVVFFSFFDDQLVVYHSRFIAISLCQGSVEDFLVDAGLYYSNGTYIGPATEKRMLEYFLNNNSDSDTYVSASRERSMSMFSSFNSSAPMYFNVVENHDDRHNISHTYNFFFFYAWNGCSNQQLLYHDSGDSQYIYDYVACDFAIHEGDWEHMRYI